MTANAFANRVYVNTATTGQGTVTLSTAVSGNVLTDVDAGMVGGQTYAYAIEESTDMEVGYGVYTVSGRTLTRTVTKSKIGGSVGTTKMTLAGAATVRITELADDIAGFLASNIGGSTGGTTNALLKANGTGGITLQASGIVVDGSNNMSGVGTLAAGAITLSGALDISGASAGQINFPATQNPSSGANVFDDYEEGTWTPLFTANGSGTSVAYVGQSGTYTKAARILHERGILSLSNNGTGVGNASIYGLPFTSDGSISFFGFPYWGGTSVIVGNLIGLCPPSDTQIQLYMGGASSGANCTDTNITNSFYGQFSGVSAASA